MSLHRPLATAGRRRPVPIVRWAPAVLLCVVGTAAHLHARPLPYAASESPTLPVGDALQARGQAGVASLAEAPSNLDAIFAQLEKMKGFEASFEEKKHLALLKAPLTSRGKLYYLAPGKLVRWVEHPEKMKITVSGGEVRIEDASGARDVDLSNRPGVAAFVTAFSHFLDGNQGKLAEHFRLHYERDSAGQWTLTMTPRREPLTHVVQSMQMRGRGTTISELVVEEKNGDRTVTLLSEVNERRQFSEEEKKRIFGK